MKLGDVVKYLSKLDRVVIWQIDIYTDNDEYEKIFEGFIMDIPWVYMDYYLANDEEDEAISARDYGDGYSGFVISVKEEK